MARHSKSHKLAGKSDRAKGPTESNAKRTMSMDEILGITTMEVEPVIQSVEDDLCDIQ